jgi:DNA-binding LytR/AlgR family response regulator
MRVLIADDEPIALEILRDHVASISGLELAGEASTGPEALQKIFDLHPDLALLDLQMPQLDGLSVARSLSGGRDLFVIFVTAHEQHAVEAFEVGAVDYLLKPVRRERLEQAVEKARRLWKSAVTTPEPARKVVGRRGSDLYLLDPETIVAFRAEGELVYIFVASGSERYLADHTLKELEAKLGQPRFRRVHRNTIINTDHIRRISPLSSKRWLLKMSNGFEAIVSKRLAGAIREQSRW